MKPRFLIDARVHLNSYHEATGRPTEATVRDLLAKNDNVFADIPGLTLGELEYELERYMAMGLKEMVNSMGDPGRQLLYGSDRSPVRMKPYAAFLDGLGFEGEALENVAWRAAARLFRIDVGAFDRAGDEREA